MEIDCSRRSFLKGSAVAAAAYAIGPPVIARTIRASVIVVGAGAFGGWSALQLLQKREKVTLLDAWGVGNSRASSGGETRTILATYGLALFLYPQMVVRALPLWLEHERLATMKL